MCKAEHKNGEDLMIDISDIHTSYPDSWVEDVPTRYEYRDLDANGRCPPLWENIYRAGVRTGCRWLFRRHTVRHEHGGWDAWYALSDAGRIAKVQAYETQSGCGDGCILKGGMRIPRDDYVEISRRLAEKPYSSRGVLVYPNKPFGPRPAKDRVHRFTWARGMPRAHMDGSIYKISEMDPVADKDMITDQIQRLKNLKMVLEDYPGCKVDGYDYSGIDEVFGPATVTFKVREVGGTDSTGVLQGARVEIAGKGCTTNDKGNCVVKIARNAQFTARISKSGYKDTTLTLNSGIGGYRMVYMKEGYEAPVEVEPEVESPVIPGFELDEPFKDYQKPSYTEKLKDPKVILVMGVIVIAVVAAVAISKKGD